MLHPCWRCASVHVAGDCWPPAAGCPHLGLLCMQLLCQLFVRVRLDGQRSLH